MSKHIIAMSKLSFSCLAVDAAEIGGRKLLLPGDISKVTCNYMEKSAEPIVVADNEPSECETLSEEDSRNNEGGNVKQFLCQTDVNKP